MDLRRRWIRRAAQAAACTFALGAGALSVELERALQHGDVGPVAHAATRPLAPAPEPMAAFGEASAPAPVPVPPPVTGPFTIDTPDWSQGAIITGGTPHRMIHFTFDDGPDRRTTPALLDQLDRLGIKATFFVTTQRMASPGNRARAERAILEEIVRRGHTIGNHTVRHQQLPLLNTVEARAEIEEAARLIEDVAGVRPRLVRPPGGSRSPRIDGLLAEMGYTQVLWNLGSGDFQVRTADEVVTTFQRVLARRSRENGEMGGIVLLHDTHPWSIAALPRIVAALREENCQLLDRGGELYDIVDDPSFFFSQRNDAGDIAPPASPPAEVRRARQARLRQETEARCQAVAQNTSVPSAETP